MSLRRFFLPPDAFTGQTITITGEPFHHMAKVLRLKPGTKVILADGAGREEIATIRSIEPECLVAQLADAPVTLPVSSGTRITLCQGLPKGDKIDLILQKATELGAHEIIVFVATRSIPRLDRQRVDNRLVRWERIVREAARQAGRSDIPRVSLAQDLAEVLRLGEHSAKLLLWEGEHLRHLRDTLSPEPPASVAFIVGPEGGLTPAEAECAVTAGYLPVTLGTRILRTETASLAMLAILQFQWGDIG